MWGQWWNAIAYGLLSVAFGASLFKQESYEIRNNLFLFYLGMCIVTLLAFIIYLCVSPMDEIIDAVCDGFNGDDRNLWTSCESDINGILGLFWTIIMAIYIIIEIIFLRILYYYAQEVKPDNGSYTVLSSSNQQVPVAHYNQPAQPTAAVTPNTMA